MNPSPRVKIDRLRPAGVTGASGGFAGARTGARVNEADALERLGFLHGILIQLIQQFS